MLMLALLTLCCCRKFNCCTETATTREKSLQCDILICLICRKYHSTIHQPALCCVAMICCDIRVVGKSMSWFLLNIKAVHHSNLFTIHKWFVPDMCSVCCCCCSCCYCLYCCFCFCFCFSCWWCLTVAHSIEVVQRYLTDFFHFIEMINFSITKKDNVVSPQ